MMLRLFLTTIVVALVTGCSSSSVTVRSISFQAAGPVASVRFAEVTVLGNVLADTLGPELRHFLGFSLEARGIRVVTASNARADLDVSLELRPARVAKGIEERHTLVVDARIGRAGQPAARVFTVYEGDEPIGPGEKLLSLAEGIAAAILKTAKQP